MNGFEQWIWVPEKLYPDCQKSAFSDMSEKKMDPYCVAEFKKDYVFDGDVQELRLKVCGDAAFQLYLNGACVMTGPATVGGDFLGNDDQPGQYYAYQAVLPVKGCTTAPWFRGEPCLLSILTLSSLPSQKSLVCLVVFL